VLVDPDGTELITMVKSPSAPNAFEVVKTSIATGRVVSVLGAVVAECADPAGGYNLAIVALLSQLTFASDTPNDGEFRGRNALSGRVARVS
jgi:hypothetical protein